jgi:hypothetical protein
LNPRRRDHCERLIRFLAWHGKKIWLGDTVGRDYYGEIRDECGLDRYQADGAIDDLYTLGLVDVSTGGGGAPVVVTLLGDDIDAPAVPPPAYQMLAGRGRR